MISWVAEGEEAASVPNVNLQVYVVSSSVAGDDFVRVATLSSNASTKSSTPVGKSPALVDQVTEGPSSLPVNVQVIPNPAFVCTYLDISVMVATEIIHRVIFSYSRKTITI